MFNIDKYTEIKDFLEKNQLSTKIIAISKNHKIESINEAIQYGIYEFGENRVFEALNKFENLKKQNQMIKLHLTGPLQSNKVKIAVELFDVFHTLDREKIATEFSKYQKKLINKKIFIQVNIGEEKNKSGIPPKETKEFINFCKKEKNLTICGLMCIPPIDDDPKKYFSYLNKLAKENNMNELSIGMSSDYECALEFNPSYIRIGTLLFGNRND